MAISLVGSGANDATNANVSVDLPVGTAQNDVVYAAGGAGDATSDINIAMNTAGYTELADVYANDNNDANLGVFRKVQGGTPDTTAVLTSLGNVDNILLVYVLRGVDTTTPEDATTTSTTGTNTGTANPPSITTVTNNAWVLAIGLSTNTGTISAPANFTDLLQHTTVGEQSSAAISRREKATAGAEDPGTYTWGGSTSHSWGAATVAARPSTAVAFARSFGFIF